jgi:hypothetical protein
MRFQNSGTVWGGTLIVSCSDMSRQFFVALIACGSGSGSASIIQMSVPMCMKRVRGVGCGSGSGSVGGVQGSGSTPAVAGSNMNMQFFVALIGISQM